uniref:Uncharacterized protein At4g00950 n=1 Tax=Anthurium amnicola TaxID=1678845 RepID=A0A1D1Z4S3_9ARAE
MGSERAGVTNSGTKTPPRLCYHALPSQPRTEPLGVATPPLQAPGSVPFYWEEAPGKPRISDDPHGAPKPTCSRSLVPPPRLGLQSSSQAPAWQVAKVADAEGVPSKAHLGGPYYLVLGPSASLFDGPSVVARPNSLSCASFTIGERERSFERRKERPVGLLRRRKTAVASSPVEAAAAAACKCYVDDGKSVGGGDGEVAPPVEASVRITRFRRSASLPDRSTTTTHLWVRC